MISRISVTRAAMVSAALAAASAAACAAPTESCTPPADIIGTWSYAAEQQAAGAVTLAGALAIDHQACRDFDGSMDVVQVDALGRQSRLAGRVTGRLLDAQSLQFDVMLNAVPRQHLASIKGDSMSGSWLEVGEGAGTGGSFRGKREAVR